MSVPQQLGEALRRLVGKCLCASVKVKAQQFFKPFQYGVACLYGAEIIVHGLRDCIEQHWLEDGFVVLKVDLKNAFNIVSRQAVLTECAVHFPELLPWTNWCYGHHPHPLDCLTSELGVQQGDPLGGPLLFSLVLNILVSAISTRNDRAGLNIHAWYMDDGALVGPRSSVMNVLALLQELGPPLGLHVNIRKCEVFSQCSLDVFPADFCHQCISHKWSEAQNLLSKLADVGLVDPQVALTLHRICGGLPTSHVPHLHHYLGSPQVVQPRCS